MKKSFIAAFAALTIALVPAAALASDDITVTLDGKAIDFDVQPQIMNERTMVPLRAIFEALGADVTWDQATETVTAVKDDTTVSMTIGRNIIYVNQKPIELDIAPVIVDERTLVPVRAVAESFGSAVDWDGESRTVIIKSEVEKIANAAYEKLVESIKKVAEYDAAAGMYTYKLPALLQKTNINVLYNENSGVISLVVDKTEDGMNVSYVLSTDRNSSAHLMISGASSDGNTKYGITGEYIDGKLNITGSNLDEAMYSAVMSEYDEVYKTISAMLEMLGVSMSDIGF